MLLVGVGPEERVDHEVGRAGEITGVEERLLAPPDLAQRVVRLDEVRGCVQEHELLEPVGNR